MNRKIVPVKKSSNYQNNPVSYNRQTQELSLVVETVEIQATENLISLTDTEPNF